MLHDAVNAVVPGTVDLRKGTEVFKSSLPWGYLIVHLDHHAALHAGWTVEKVAELRASGTKVVITQHDTYELRRTMDERGLPNFQPVVDALIVHEWVEGLTDQDYDNVYCWRQPVPNMPRGAKEWPEAIISKAPRNNPPIVASVGFDFPWKGFGWLRKAATAAGWQTRIFGGSESWLSRGQLIQALRECDATAFLYQTGNSGTSAAIRMGIAARRPVIALEGCRQFRDLEQYPPALLWAENTRVVTDMLRELAINSELYQRCSQTIENLASMDSWANAGHRYLNLYHDLTS